MFVGIGNWNSHGELPVCCDKDLSSGNPASTQEITTDPKRFKPERPIYFCDYLGEKTETESTAGVLEKKVCLWLSRLQTWLIRTSWCIFIHWNVTVKQRGHIILAVWWLWHSWKRKRKKMTQHSCFSNADYLPNARVPLPRPLPCTDTRTQRSRALARLLHKHMFMEYTHITLFHVLSVCNITGSMYVSLECIFFPLRFSFIWRKESVFALSELSRWAGRLSVWAWQKLYQCDFVRQI